MICFFVLWFIAEIIFQIYKRRETLFKVPSVIISKDDFKKRVSNGERLMILDDFVIDLKSFLMNHPGGKFVLEQNIGRDISKFFYGGY